MKQRFAGGLENYRVGRRTWRIYGGIAIDGREFKILAYLLRNETPDPVFVPEKPQLVSKMCCCDKAKPKKDDGWRPVR
jgi:hypothetical protein